MSDGRVERRQRWIAATGRWLALLGIAFVLAYTTWVLAPEAAASAAVVFNVVFAVTWTAFLLGYWALGFPLGFGASYEYVPAG